MVGNHGMSYIISNLPKVATWRSKGFRIRPLIAEKTTKLLFRGTFGHGVVKKDPGRASRNSLSTAGTNFTKPGAQNKGDLCIRRGENSVKTPDMTGAEVQRKGERDRDWVALC